MEPTEAKARPQARTKNFSPLLQDSDSPTPLFVIRTKSAEIRLILCMVVWFRAQTWGEVMVRPDGFIPGLLIPYCLFFKLEAEVA
jgi:hypothetical protein